MAEGKWKVEVQKLRSRRDENERNIEISQPKKERKTSTLPDRSDVAEHGSSRARVCIVCDQVKGSFSHNQWLKGEGKSKCRDCVTKESNMKEERGTSFGGFFSEGSIGCQLFQMDGGIRSCERFGIMLANWSLQQMCRTYTVPELVETINLALPTLDLPIALGTEVMTKVRTHLRRKKKSKIPGAESRPNTLFTRTAANKFWAYLYHPDELKQVHCIIDRHLRKHGVDKNSSEGKVPVLLSAFYGTRGHDSRRKDVTRKVKSFIKDKELVLLQPPNNRIHYWYNALFGDPSPNFPKTLEIVTRNESTGVRKRRRFREDSRVSMRLASQPK